MSGGQPDQDVDLFRLAAEAGNALRARGWTLAAAESCTGGWVAKALTDVPGSSACFSGGIVAYANTIKRGLLGVSARDLEAHGAVSEVVATAMARGALGRFSADIAVAVSGVAGPGASEGKPAGLVCFAWAWGREGPIATQSLTRQFAGDREAVRRASVREALAQTLSVVTRDIDRRGT
ncbi:nicotinamide-nucleotide amidase [soil metagenome]